jgi:hypothetical protein
VASKGLRQKSIIFPQFFLSDAKFLEEFWKLIDILDEVCAHFELLLFLGACGEEEGRLLDD